MVKPSMSLTEVLGGVFGVVVSAATLVAVTLL
jgi:hypothetical protein